MTSGFEQSRAQLHDIDQQQRGLAALVASGELWMEEGVAERAARCDQAVEDINKWMNGADRLTQLRKFGDNGGWSGDRGPVRSSRSTIHRLDAARPAGVREHGGDLPGGRAHGR